MGVTILICTYNGKSKLPATLDAIACLKTSYEWELVIVDNASTDQTFEFCTQYLENVNFKARVLKFDIPGKMFAFWFGVQNAQYSFILDCDDDNHLNEDYLEIGLSTLQANKNIGALGGKGIPVLNRTPPIWFDKFAKSYAIGPQSVQDGKLPGHILGLYGAGTYFNANALNTLLKAGFKNSLSCRKGNQLTSGGDTELCLALKKLGYEIWFLDSLQFGHAISNDRLTWEYYLKLKRGIASSFPLLEAYEFDKFSSGKKFKLFLFGKWILALKGFFKTLLLLPFGSLENEVAFEICKTKVVVFFLNRIDAVNSYYELKRMFKKGNV